jgi:hypothetical protein
MPSAKKRPSFDRARRNIMVVRSRSTSHLDRHALPDSFCHDCVALSEATAPYSPSLRPAERRVNTGPRDTTALSDKSEEAPVMNPWFIFSIPTLAVSTISGSSANAWRTGFGSRPTSADPDESGGTKDQCLDQSTPKEAPPSPKGSRLGYRKPRRAPRRAALKAGCVATDKETRV